MKNFLKNEISTVTLLTVSMYSLAYIYQIGYSKFFNYPMDFISVDLTMLLQTFVGIIVFPLAVSFMLKLFCDTAPPAINISLIIIFVFLIWYILSAIIGFDSAYSQDTYKAYLIAYSFIFSLSLILIATFLIKLKEFLPRSPLKFCLFLSLMFLLLSFCTGYLYASKTEHMYEDKDGFVLLNSFGNYFVLSKCNDGEASFRKIEQNQSQPLSLISGAKVKKIKRCLALIG